MEGLQKIVDFIGVKVSIKWKQNDGAELVILKPVKYKYTGAIITPGKRPCLGEVKIAEIDVQCHKQFWYRFPKAIFSFLFQTTHNIKCKH